MRFPRATRQHRLFCHITQTWRGTPLTSRLAVVELIASTTTKATPNNERVGWDRGRGGADSGVSRCRVSSPHVRCFIDSRTVCGG